MKSALLSIRESTVTPTTCLLKSRLKVDLDALTATISSLEAGLKEPKTIRDFVHPESLRFALQQALERKDILLAEYESHLLVHGC